jgi:dTDP-4-dehydrorhamnose 3,5-epimerase
VDIRPGSASFGRWVGVELNDTDLKMFWLPPGLAHGFLVLSDSADFTYKTTSYYAPAHEGCIRWDDPDLAINWPDPGVEMRVSEKDARGQLFASLVG